MSNARRARNRDIAEICRVPINEKRVEEHKVWEYHLIDKSFDTYTILLEYVCFPSWLCGQAKKAFWCTANQWLEVIDLERSSVITTTSLVSLASVVLSLCKSFLYTQMLNSANFLPGLVLVSAPYHKLVSFRVYLFSEYVFFFFLI